MTKNKVESKYKKTNIMRGSIGAVFSRLLVLSLMIFTGLYSSIGFTASYKIKNIEHLFDLDSAGGSSLTLPSDVAVNKTHIYIVDGTNHRVVAYNKKGRYLFTIGGGKGKKQIFNYPVGMTVSGDKIYIADTGNHKIRIFTLKGKPVRTFKIYSEDQEERPIDIAVSKRGKEIYVTGNNNHHILVYSDKGKFIREWGGRGTRKGKFRYPATMINLNRRQKVIVDALNARVQIITNKGKFVRQFGSLGVVAGKFYRPKGVAKDEEGNLYVSDSYMELIQVFDSSGEFLHILGKSGKIRRFSAPSGIAIYDNKLYVTEVLDSKISVFSLD